MKKSFTNVIKNLLIMIVSQSLTFIINALTITILPKILGIYEYSYYQLYLFYCTYGALFHFGFNDGIYLRYGGVEYKNLNKNLFKTMLIILCFIELFLSTLIIFFTLIFISEKNEKVIYFAISIYIVIIMPLALFYYILQITNRIKEYSLIITIDRIVFIIGVGFALIFLNKVFYFIIIMDICAHLIGLLIGCYFCKELFFSEIVLCKSNILEFFKNMKVGFKLMLSNISGLLVLGFSRYIISVFWSVEVFGKISLTISISNVLLMFVSVVSMVIYPLLKRTKDCILTEIYLKMRLLLIITMYGFLIFYEPFKSFFIYYLPGYSDSIEYMIYIMPICLFESKTQLLVNTYLKTFRKENVLLIISAISVSITIIFSLVSALIFYNLSMIIISMLIATAFRSIVGEFVVMKLLKVNLKANLIIENILIIIFLLAGIFIKGYIGNVIYVFVYITYLIVFRNDIISTMKRFHKLICIS